MPAKSSQKKRWFLNPALLLERWPRLPFWLLIIVPTLLVYLNSMHGEFHFDDKQNILENEAIRSFANWKQVLRAEYRGLLWLTFMFNYWFSGYETFGWHVVNLGLHVANGLLIFSFLTRLYPSRPQTVPLFATLLFLLHPIQTESVSYIISRSELLVSFFLMLSFYFWNKHRDLPKKDYNRVTLPWFLSVVFYAAGLWTKENALIFFVLLIAFEVYFPDARLSVKNSQGKPQMLMAFLRFLRLWPFLLLFISWWILRAYLQQGTLGNQDSKSIPQADSYLWTQSRVVMHYLRLLITPINLNLDPDFPLSKSWAEPWVLICTFFHGAILSLALFLRKKAPQIGFGIIWFYVHLAPSSSFIALRDAMAEHRTYLATLGFFWIFTYVLDSAPDWFHRFSPGVPKSNSLRAVQGNEKKVFAPDTRWLWVPVVFFTVTYFSYFVFLQVISKITSKPMTYLSFAVAFASGIGCIASFFTWRRAPRHPLRFGPALLTSFVLVYGVMTVQRNLVYQNGITMWGDVITKSPMKARPHYNLGNAYFNANQFDLAIEHYTKAVTLKPDYVAPFFNRGNTFNRLGRLREALQDYEQTIRIEPKFYQGWYNRGAVLQQFGQKKEALDSYKRVLEIRPSYIDAYNAIGVIHFQDGNFEEALRYFKFILGRAPKNFEALVNTGLCLHNLKRPREALPFYATAVSVAPKNPRAWLSYALCLADVGENPNLAQSALERALTLFPDYAQHQQFLDVKEKIRKLQVREK